jgi:hypothetical protein
VYSTLLPNSRWLDLLAKLFVELMDADIRGVIFSNFVSGPKAPQITVADYAFQPTNRRTGRVGDGLILGGWTQ